MLFLSEAIERAIVDHLAGELPNEGCGLLAGRPTLADDCNLVERFLPCRNELASPTRYRVDPRDQLDAELSIEAAGLAVVGVVHSHPTSPAWPSATDIAEAPVADWHYVIVSMVSATPAVESFRIRSGEVEHEPIRRP